MREGLGARQRERGWLAATLLLFCLPLFINLGGPDLQNDEAIYSFAIDRMLSTGNWLVPTTSPREDLPFFDKPPLKFWIVAAPIAAGILPGTELGHRFWDAVFGAGAFVYVFLIGRHLLNPACGFISVLILFAHAPLLFSHGLRSNNMESALVLAYCGGVYHYLKWASWSNGARGLHVQAIALYFVLAFLTKFVAALFLPLVLGITAAAVAAHRRRLIEDWRRWAVALVLVAALVVPWFAFMSARFGVRFWREILGVHVYQRMTATLDPGHLQPWSYYLLQMMAYWETGALVLVTIGLVVLAAWTARVLNPDALLIVLWFAVPTLAISAATSKLYHYLYPFLPPLALAGGYLSTLMLSLGRAPVGRFLERLDAHMTEATPRLTRALRSPAVRMLLFAAIAVSIVLAIGSLVLGRVRFTVGGTELTSAGILRPGIAAAFFAVLAGIPRRSHKALALLIVSFLPLQGYRDSLMLLADTRHPRRAASQCVRDVQTREELPRGIRVTLPEPSISQSLFYYFESIRPWRRDASAEPLPTLTTGVLSPSQSSVDLGDGVVLLLPEPYRGCGTHSSGA